MISFMSIDVVGVGGRVSWCQLVGWEEGSVGVSWCLFNPPLSRGLQANVLPNQLACSILIRVVHFTTDAVNRHLTVRRNLRSGPSQIELQA